MESVFFVGGAVPAAEVLGRYPLVFLEILAEETLRGEIEAFGYLLVAEVCGAQQNLGVGDGVVLYPVHGCDSGVAFNGAGQVFRGDTEPFGIKVEESLLAVVSVHEHYEVFRELHGLEVLSRFETCVTVITHLEEGEEDNVEDALVVIGFGDVADGLDQYVVQVVVYR